LIIFVLFLSNIWSISTIFDFSLRICNLHAMTYLYLKALHIIFLVTWFAGLFYMVRLFIYQTEANDKAEPDRTILLNEYQRISRLLWYMITWPSAVLTLVSGLYLLPAYPVWPGWLIIKIWLVGLLYLYHFLCHYIYSNLQKGTYPLSSYQLRIWNEVATLLLVSIVFLVVLKSALDMTYGILGLVIFGVVLMLSIYLYKKFRNK